MFISAFSEEPGEGHAHGPGKLCSLMAEGKWFLEALLGYR